MDETIRVQVIKFSDRDNLVMRYLDPLTGRQVTRTAGTPNRRDAEREAGKWQAELREGRYQRPSRMTWPDFREKYEREVLASLATSTQHKTGYVLDLVERILNPNRVRDLSAARLSHLQGELRKGQQLKGRERRPCAPATVDGYMRTLKAALACAVDWGYMPALPKVRREKRAQADSKAKGRPITTEEFERMLVAVPRVLKARPNTSGVDVVTPWRHYLHGLWLSGLRLGESLRLYWDRHDSPDASCLEVDLTGRRPMLVIPSAIDKGKRDRLLPVTPDFAEFLEQTPADARKGPVFTPGVVWQHEGHERRQERISRTLGAFGAKAGVVVNESGKCASAHDLRRSFGRRWAAKVMPHILMQLMRHAEVATTMKYYAGRDAEAVADVLWATEGNNLGNNAQISAAEQVARVGASASHE